MGARSSTQSQTPALGASRWVDFTWPDPLQLVTTASANTQGRSRLLNGQVTVATGGFGGGGATVNVTNTAADGYLSNVLGAGAADGVGQIVRPNAGTAAAIFQQQSRTNSLVPSSDYQDLGCARVYAIYSLSAFGGGSPIADCGLEVTGGGGLIQSQSTIGVGYGRSAQGIIQARCQTVGGGASSNVAVTGAGTSFVGFDESKKHAYEMQFTSATATVEATVSWVIDGIRVRSLSYGAGTVLPPLGGTVNACWTALLVNVAANVASMQVWYLRIIQAPTIAACY